MEVDPYRAGVSVHEQPCFNWLQWDFSYYQEKLCVCKGNDSGRKKVILCIFDYVLCCSTFLHQQLVEVLQKGLFWNSIHWYHFSVLTLVAANINILERVWIGPFSCFMRFQKVMSSTEIWEIKRYSTSILIYANIGITSMVHYVVFLRFYV